MFHTGLIVLSYHKFSEEQLEYTFSRTFEQFENDLLTKTFDLITIDDCSISQIQACEILRKMNIRAKLFCPTSLIGTDGYCTWSEMKELSKYHDIENHSYNHVNLQEIPESEVFLNIEKASSDILKHIGKKPRYFVPPFNKSSDLINTIAKELGLILINNRIDITKDSL